MCIGTGWHTANAATAVFSGLRDGLMITARGVHPGQPRAGNVSQHTAVPRSAAWPVSADDGEF